MYTYMTNTDTLRIQVQKELSRYMEKIIKAFSIYTSASPSPSTIVLDEQEEEEPAVKKQKQETA